MRNDQTPQGTDEREVRHKRLLLGQISSKRLHMQKIVIRNMSALGIGAMIQSQPPFRGETVTVCFPDGMKRTGTVRWVHRRNFGVQFDVPMEVEPTSASAPSPPPKWEVPRQFQPESDCRRPGLRVR